MHGKLFSKLFQLSLLESLALLSRQYFNHSVDNVLIQSINLSLKLLVIQVAKREIFMGGPNFNFTSANFYIHIQLIT